MGLFEIVAARLLAQRNSHISVEVRERLKRAEAGQLITWAEYADARLNSWEREALYPYLDDDCLIQLLERIMLPNATPKYRCGPCSTYDESLIHNFIPELIRRLKEKINASDPKGQVSQGETATRVERSA